MINTEGQQTVFEVSKYPNGRIHKFVELKSRKQRQANEYLSQSSRGA